MSALSDPQADRLHRFPGKAMDLPMKSRQPLPEMAWAGCIPVSWAIQAGGLAATGFLVTFSAAQPFREISGCCRGKRAGEVPADICRCEPADLRPVFEQKQVAVDSAGDDFVGHVSPKIFSGDSGFRCCGIANDRDLFGLPKEEIERTKIIAESRWMGCLGIKPATLSRTELQAAASDRRPVNSASRSRASAAPELPDGMALS